VNFNNSILTVCMSVCVCVCMYYVCMYVRVCIFLYVCMYVCMYVCVCVFLYVCMYVCVYVCIIPVIKTQCICTYISRLKCSWYRIQYKDRDLQNCNFACLLYGYDGWCPSRRKEHTPRIFQNRVLRKIFGPNRYEVTWE